MELVAAAVLVLSVQSPLTASVAIRGGVLLGLALGFAQLVRRVQRLRTYLVVDSSVPFTMPLSVWSFAAVVALPVGWAVVVHAVLYLQEYVHTRRDRTIAAHRELFTAAAALLAQAATATLVSAAGGLSQSATVLVLVGAALLYTGLNLLIMLVGIALASGRRLCRAMLPEADAFAYELSCLATGLCLGELLLNSPYAAPVLLGPIVYLQRSAMIKELRDATRVDAKTGVLNSTAWRQHAETVLDRCAQRRDDVAVFVVDIDDFKRINDTYGHLVGDRVLDQVTATLRAGVRSADAIGRFGGDEFVLVLDAVDFPTAYDIGERIRRAAAELDVDGARVSVSVGLAHLTGDLLPAALDDVLTQADAALYRAKTAGRDRLCVAPV